MSAKTPKQVKNSKKSVKLTQCYLTKRRKIPTTSTAMREWEDSVRKTYLTILTSKIFSVASDSEETVAVGEQVVLRAYSIFLDLEEVVVADHSRAMMCYMK
ncbi:hypothetical protein DSECCO2_155130 [anaerobic digester metagenome]